MNQAATKTVSAEDTQDLAVLIGAGAEFSTLAAYLDGLDPQVRVQEVQGLGAPLLRLLYERCEKAPPLTLTDLVPATTPVASQVIFAGVNNLPLFRRFEKRFARTQSGAIVGFNFQPMSAFTGPGYFTVRPAGAELVIDYTAVPEADSVPAEWPAVRKNDSGLSLTYFVYKNLHDYCRRVSADVVIGHATRLGKSMPQYFVLARRPSS